MFWVVSGVIVALVGFTADLEDKPATMPPSELQGTWRLVSVEIRGEVNDPATSYPRWVIKGDKVIYGGEELASISADASTSPKSIDLAFRDPKSNYEGIWSIDKDKLTICLNGRSETVKERPVEFSTKDKDNMRLLVFERVKNKREDPTGDAAGFVGLVMRFDNKTKQIIVNDVLAGSPAKKAGLKKDDVILKMAGAAATDLASAVNSVRQVQPGREVAIVIRRDGNEKEIIVKAGVLPFRFIAGLE